MTTQKVICDTLDYISEYYPLPRSGHCMVTDENNLYVIGGFVQYTTHLEVEGEIWQYNFLCGRWRNLQFRNLNFTLAASHAVCPIGHTVVIHGGTGTQFGQEIDNKLTVINLITHDSYMLSYSPKDGLRHNMPLPTYGHTITLVSLDDESYLYKIGGVKSTTYTMNVYRYSMRHKTWERVSHEHDKNLWRPSPRYRHDTILYGQKLHIVAGGNADVTHPLWPMPVLDPKTHIWSRLEFVGTRPPLIRYQSSTLVDHRIYVTGGLDDDDNISGDIFCMDLQTLSCSKIGTQMSPTYFHSVAFVPHIREIYSFGGNISTDPVTRTNQLVRLQLRDRPLHLVDAVWLRFVGLLVQRNWIFSSIREALWSVDLPEVSRKSEAIHIISEILQEMRSSIIANFQYPLPPLSTCVKLFNSSSVTFPPTGYNMLQATLKAAALVLLIQYGQILGLHSEPWMMTKINPQTSLLEMISACNSSNCQLSDYLNQVTKCCGEGDPENIHAQRQTRASCVKELSQRINECLCGPPPEKHPRSMSSQAPLPLYHNLDEFFIVLFLYTLHLPSKLISRLPEGQTYLDYIHALDSIVAKHNVSQPA